MRTYKLIRRGKKDCFGELLLKKKTSILAQNLVFTKQRRSSFVFEFLYKPQNYVGHKKLKRKKPSSFFAKRLLLRRQFLGMYGFYRLKTFRQFLKKSVIKSRLFSAEDVLMVLECRLSVIVYRLGFVSSVLMGIAYVRQGIFLVNRLVVSNPNFLVKVGDVVEVHYAYRYSIFRYFYLRRLLNLIKVVCPRYFEVNYPCMVAVMFRRPLISEIPGYLDKFPKNYLLEEYKVM